MIVADTNVLIDCLTGKGEADAVELVLRRGALRTTGISRCKLLSGARSPKLEAVPSLSLDDAGADAASEIRRVLERSGNAIGMADSLIAGIVTSNGDCH